MAVASPQAPAEAADEIVTTLSLNRRLDPFAPRYLFPLHWANSFLCRSSSRFNAGYVHFAIFLSETIA